MKSKNKTQHSDIDMFDEVHLDEDANAFLHTLDLWEDAEFNADVTEYFDHPLEFLTVIRQI